MVIIVIITSNIFVLNPRLDEAKTLGIIKNITKGFVTPPVKYNNAPNCNISITKKINADLSDNCVF